MSYADLDRIARKCEQHGEGDLGVALLLGLLIWIGIGFLFL